MEEPKKKSKDKKKSKRTNETSASADVSLVPKDEKKKKRKQQDAETGNIASSSRSVTTPPSQVEIEKFLADNSITIHGTPLTPILSFDQLDVPAGLRAACDGFEAPTPIQACSWPPTLAGQDVVGIAETGR